MEPISGDHKVPIGWFNLAVSLPSGTRIIEKHGQSWKIGETRLNPLLFQDDIFAANKT